MLALALTVALAQTPLEADTDDPRLEPRFRWAAQAIGVFSVGGGSFGGGPGIQLEAGAVLHDTLSLTARVFGAFFGNTGDAGGSLGADFALGRFFTLGAGLGVHGFTFIEAGNAATLGIPIRVTFNPMQRAPEAIRRKTLIIGFELTPSLVILAGRGRVGGSRTVPDFGFSTMLTIGYGWW